MIAANDIAKPALGQKTDTPTSGMFGGRVFSSVPLGIETTGGMDSGVGAVWPAWNSLLLGTYGTYRAMLRHPTIAFVVSQVLGPVLGNTWQVDADDDAPQAVKDWLTENIIAKRDQIIAHAARSVVMRNSPFEVVWAMDAGKFAVDRFVPLLPDDTTVLRERGGRGPFAGLQNGQAKLAPAECLYVRNQSDAISDEPGDDYGRSRLENIRDTAWTGWLDTARRLAELEDRVSGIIPIILVPTGSPVDAETNPATNKPYTYFELASALLPSLNHPRSMGGVIEMPAIGVMDADQRPGAFKQVFTAITTIDMGNRAPSQAAMQEKLKYWDEKIGEGLYRSARTLFATKGGTKADAEQHTANSEPDAEAIDQMICAQVNQQTARTGLSLNFGPDVLAKVRGVKPVPIVDQDAQRANALLTAMFANAQLAVALGQKIDVGHLLDQAHAPTYEEVDFRTVLTGMIAEANKAKQAQQAAFQQQQGNQPPPNGKPMSERTVRAVRTVTGGRN